MVRLGWGILVVVLLAGCVPDPNVAACEGFLSRADSFLTSTGDHLKAGDTAVGESLMRELPESLAGYSDAATGNVQVAMDSFITRVGQFNTGAAPDLRGSLDTVRAACQR